MKIIYYLLCIICFSFCSKTLQANILSDYRTNLRIDHQTKTKPSAESKSPYQKYAAVSFISKRSLTTTDVSQGDDLDENPIKKTMCPNGEEEVNGICIDVAACKKDFPLSSASKTVGFYMSKNCGSKGMGYCYSTCQTGWKKNECDCNPNNCAGYPLETSLRVNCNGIESCKTGNSYKYKCTSCPMGYKLNNGTCIEKGCTDYSKTHLSTLTEHCVSISAAKVGEHYCYQCTECETGWNLSSGTCIANTCNYSLMHNSKCAHETVTRTGDVLCYQCTKCELGYELKGQTCIALTQPNNSTLGSMIDSYARSCSSISDGKAGENFYFRCIK